MNRFINKYTAVILSVAFALGIFSSCEEFFEPRQGTTVTEENMYSDWYEYRSASMGLYALQQDLVEQLMILGELRGDLLETTANATADMVEVYNFNVSSDNQYASPEKFFKLIAATNRFIVNLSTVHPEVLDSAKAVTNYDKLYGEAICMRAWAYFNAARIYGQVPYIPENLTEETEIDNYIASSDVKYIKYKFTGSGNAITPDIDLSILIDQLENNIKEEGVGVNHYINNDDDTWEVSIWNIWAWHTLLGHMYLSIGEDMKAIDQFELVTVYNNSTNYRYQLDQAFANGSWKNIMTAIDTREHIFTLWFNKANQQQNSFQQMFEKRAPHLYQLKPTKVAVQKWESQWRGHSISKDVNAPNTTRVTNIGTGGDTYRGNNVSYVYDNNGIQLPDSSFAEMSRMRALGEDRYVEEMMDGYDTLVYKYSISKDIYDQDAPYIIYRAGGVNLYMAEIYNGPTYNNSTKALRVINSGENYDASNNREQRGVRGRIGLGSGESRIYIDSYIYTYDPYTNKFLGYSNWDGNAELAHKRRWIEEKIIEERALELAYEGERFYDLIRVAGRRGDATFLSSRVASKFPSARQQQMKELLNDPSNWYIHYFD